MLVTGASRGIGAATARLAARRGFDVAVHAHRSLEAAEEVAADVRATGRRALLLCADVAHEAEVVALFAHLDSEWGRLDVLVNNAGILDTQMPLAEMSGERIQRILDVNVLGSLLCAREAVRRIARSAGGEGGVIVNVSSGAARLGSPGEYIDYAASKGAIDTFTIGLAKEVASDGIRVSAVRPGVIDTEIHASGGEPDRPKRLRERIPTQRPGTAQEVAEAILWLASDAAAYSHGSILDVTGGL
ncbi:MAG: SDR family oxidoreductase [Myxococcota bacterium]